MEDAHPVFYSMEVDDVPMMQPVGFVWFSKPRYRVRAGSNRIMANAD